MTPRPPPAFKAKLRSLWKRLQREGIPRALDVVRTIQKGGPKRWAAPLVLLLLTVTAWFILFGKMRREVWTYFTDDQGNEVEVDDEKTRFVLWEDPQPHAFEEVATRDQGKPDVKPDRTTNAPSQRLEAAFSPNGTVMILVRSSEEEDHADLYQSRWDGRYWSKPEPLIKINTPANERGPAFSRDGRFLYFSSDRADGEGGYDLYVAQWSGHDWDHVAGLGSSINSDADETGPALAPEDSHLYFSSTREGAKESDIFAAKATGTDPPKEGEPLPTPEFDDAELVSHLNSKKEDLQAALTARGDHVFIASDRDRTRKQGYQLYLSRVVDGESLPPEKVNLYFEEGDITDPAVRMDGFDLLFSTNVGVKSLEEDENYRLYRSTTREVIGYTDLDRFEQWKDVLGNIIWWLLLALAAIIALIYLLEKWQDITSLFHKCLAGSAAAHLLLLVLAMVWLIAKEFEKEEELPVVDVQLDVVTEESLALESAPEETETNEPDLSMDSQKAQANFNVPEDMQAQHSPAEDIPVESQVQPEAVEIEAQPTNAQTSEETFDEQQPQEPSALLAELSDPDLIEPDKPVLEELEPLEAPPEQPENDPQPEPLPATVQQDTKPLEDTAMETEVPEIDPAQAVVDPNPLNEVTPEQAQFNPEELPEQANPLDSELLEQLPDAGTVDAENPVLEENPDTGPANPNNEGDPNFDPGNVPGNASQQSPSNAPGDTADTNATDPGQVAPGNSAINPADAGNANATPTEPGAESNVPNELGPTGTNHEIPDNEIFDPGRPDNFEEGPQENAPRNDNQDFNPDGGALTNNPNTQQAPSSITDSADSEVPDASDVGGTNIPSNSAEPGVPANLSGQPGESTTNDAPATAGLGSDLPDGGLIDPGLPDLDEGDPNPANPTGGDFNPNQIAGNSNNAPAGGSLTDNADSDQSDANNVAQGTTPTEPGDSGSFNANAESNTENALAGGGGFDSNLPDNGLIDPGIPTLDEGNLNGGPRGDSNDFTPGGSPLASQQSQGRGLDDNANSEGATANSVANTGLSPTPSNLVGPGTGMEAGGGEGSDLPGGGLGAAELGPGTFANIDPGELEGGGISPEEFANTLRGHRGRPDIEILKTLGATDGTETAIRESMRWLAENQEQSGRWDARKHGAKGRFDTGVTGLALMCFYGWGFRHDEEGKYQDHVKRALTWLKDQQNEETGDLRGGGLMYCHAIASIALCEAYGITKDPSLKDPAQRAIDYTLRAQSKSKGGWRYHPGDDSDTSITGWQYMALHSARQAGLNVPEEAFQLVRKWLDTAGGGKFGGHYGYQTPSKKSPAMVATGMFCRQLDLAPPTSPKQNESATLIKVNPIKSRNLDYYYIYYATLALFQHQGPIWIEWNERFREIVPAKQHKTGSKKGSWDPSRGLAGNGGRVASTALATLSLEVYFKLLPIYGVRGDTPDAREKKIEDE